MLKKPVKKFVPLHPLSDRPQGKQIAVALWKGHQDILRQMGSDAVERFVENECAGEPDNVIWWTKDALAQICRDNARYATPKFKESV